MTIDPVFYSFHFDNDVFRVQQVRNMGVISGNEPVSPTDWEQVKRKGDRAIETWIDENMRSAKCVVVLIGSETASRKWVLHEIEKAWNEKRGLFGVYIHNLKDPRTGTSARGPNPFEKVSTGSQSLVSRVQCYDPSSYDAYGDISRNLRGWVDSSIAAAKAR